jgi:hypothetical protein
LAQAGQKHTHASGIDLGELPAAFFRIARSTGMPDAASCLSTFASMALQRLMYAKAHENAAL